MSVKYFPFSPGLPWQLSNGHQYILPEVSQAAWEFVIRERNPVVVVNGGILESFTSLIYLELLNINFPTKKILWAGDQRFSQLLTINGLAKLSSFSIHKDILDRYPVPIFIDKNNNIYFNCLNNYIKIKTFVGNFYSNKAPILQQIISNTTQNWDLHYLPQFRNLGTPSELLSWAKTNNFYFNKPHACVFPDVKSGFSQHQVSSLGWGVNEVRALGAMLHSIGINLVVFTTQPGKYYGSQGFFLPPRLDFIFYILKSAKIILSEEIDWLLIGNICTQAILMGKELNNQFCLKNNNEFLGKENVIYLHKEFTPMDVINVLKGK